MKYQGLVLNAAAPEPIPNLRPASQFGFAQGNADQKGLELLHIGTKLMRPSIPMIHNFVRGSQPINLAAKMQLSAPEAFDLKSESAATLEQYGLESADHGRLWAAVSNWRVGLSNVESVLCRSGVDHKVRQTTGTIMVVSSANCLRLPPMSDQPIAALLADLYQRGLMEDTQVIWTTEFGVPRLLKKCRSRSQCGSFATWLCGAGCKEGRCVWGQR